MPEAQSDILIPAPPERVYQLAKNNVERFPEFLPNVQQVTIGMPKAARKEPVS